MGDHFWTSDIVSVCCPHVRIWGPTLRPSLCHILLGWGASWMTRHEKGCRMYWLKHCANNKDVDFISPSIHTWNSIQSCHRYFWQMYKRPIRKQTKSSRKEPNWGKMLKNWSNLTQTGPLSHSIETVMLPTAFGSMPCWVLSIFKKGR